MHSFVCATALSTTSTVGSSKQDSLSCWGEVCLSQVWLFPGHPASAPPCIFQPSVGRMCGSTHYTGPSLHQGERNGVTARTMSHLPLGLMDVRPGLHACPRNWQVGRLPPLPTPCRFLPLMGMRLFTEGGSFYRLGAPFVPFFGNNQLGLRMGKGIEGPAIPRKHLILHSPKGEPSFVSHVMMQRVMSESKPVPGVPGMCRGAMGGSPSVSLTSPSHTAQPQHLGPSVYLARVLHHVYSGCLTAPAGNKEDAVCLDP